MFCVKESVVYIDLFDSALCTMVVSWGWAF